MKRAFYIVGNWKMHKTRQESAEFGKKILMENLPLQEVFLAVPATALGTLSDALPQIHIGAQDVSEHIEGAYTGEISSRMIKEAGAQFSLVGHSERRLYHKETSEIVARKLKRCLQEGLEVFLCVGETLKEREEGRTAEVLFDQILKALADVEQTMMSYVKIAYEPVWAIGTGHAATIEMIESAHQIIRQALSSCYGKGAAQTMPILYGGSVNALVIEGLTQSVHVDGVLVGGASLDPQVFANLIRISKDIKQ